MSEGKNLSDILQSVDISRIAVFCIYMQNNDGIEGKAPGYMREKLELALKHPFPWQSLDGHNRRKYIMWLLQWRNNFEDGWFEKEIKSIYDFCVEEQMFINKMLDVNASS